MPTIAESLRAPFDQSLSRISFSDGTDVEPAAPASNDANAFWQSLATRYGEKLHQAHATLHLAPQSRPGNPKLSSVLHELSSSVRGQDCIEKLLGELLAVPGVRLFDLELDCDNWHPQRGVISELLHLKTSADIGRAADRVSPATLVYWIADRIKNPSKHLQVAIDRLQEQSVSDSIELLSLNVFGMPRWAGGKHHGRYRAIAHELTTSRFQRTDVVALQEMWHPKTKAIIERAGFEHHSKTREPKGVLGSNGLVTLSRHPIVASQTFEFSRRPSIERFVRKGALFSRIQMPSGLVIDVWNVHMTSTSALLNERRAAVVRREQIEELANWNEQVSVASIPKFIMGDMNTKENCEEYHELCAAFGTDIFRAHHQAEILPPATLDEFRRHYHHGYTFDPERNPIAKNPDGLPERLDYQFVSGLAGTLAIESRVEMRGPHKKGIPFSDHAAVWARLRVLKDFA